MKKRFLAITAALLLTSSISLSISTYAFFFANRSVETTFEVGIKNDNIGNLKVSYVVDSQNPYENIIYDCSGNGDTFYKANLRPKLGDKYNGIESLSEVNMNSGYYNQYTVTAQLNDTEELEHPLYLYLGSESLVNTRVQDGSGINKALRVAFIANDETVVWNQYGDFTGYVDDETIVKSNGDLDKLGYYNQKNTNRMITGTFEDVYAHNLGEYDGSNYVGETSTFTKETPYLGTFHSINDPVTFVVRTWCEGTDAACIDDNVAQLFSTFLYLYVVSLTTSTTK